MAFWKKIGQQLGDFVDDLAAPDAVRAELQRGVAALDAGRLVEAEDAFRRLMKLDPDHARARHLLGLSLLGQERLPLTPHPSPLTPHPSPLTPHPSSSRPTESS